MTELAVPLGARARSILDAARTCFELYGFHAASMARIAGEAGVSVGHIYRYFANKEAVIGAIAEQDLEDLTHDIDTLSGGPTEMAAHLLAFFERNRSRRRTALWLEVMAEGARNPKIAAMIQDAERSIRGRLTKAMSQSCLDQGCSLDSEEVERRMSLIGVLMDGLQMRMFQEGPAAPPGLKEHVGALLAQTLSIAPIEPAR